MTEHINWNPQEIKVFVPGYELLYETLLAAYQRAATGKGRTRHSNGKDFLDQPIFAIRNLVGDGFTLGQAIKKLTESKKLPPEEAVNELLDAIVYIASEVITITKEELDTNDDPYQAKQS